MKATESDPKDQAAEKAPRAVVRHYRLCTVATCSFETSRYPKPRRAELEYMDHALKTHSSSGQKRVVIERREIDV